MLVACYCGHLFESAGQLVVCPACKTPAVLPNVTDEDVDAMRRDLARAVPLVWEGDQA